MYIPVITIASGVLRSEMNFIGWLINDGSLTEKIKIINPKAMLIIGGESKILKILIFAFELSIETTP